MDSRALRKHEEGHRDTGVAAARKIAEGIAVLSPSVSCEALEWRANEEGERLVREAVERDREYDRETRHGRSLGAQLR
jgi:predicted secreted Zn-dependent protease